MLAVAQLAVALLGVTARLGKLALTLRLAKLALAQLALTLALAVPPELALPRAEVEGVLVALAEAVTEGEVLKDPPCMCGKHTS